MSIQRQIEINNRLMKIDEVLREAANEYARKTRGLAEEKAELIAERMNIMSESA